MTYPLGISEGDNLRRAAGATTSASETGLPRDILGQF